MIDCCVFVDRDPARKGLKGVLRAGDFERFLHACANFTLVILQKKRMVTNVAIEMGSFVNDEKVKVVIRQEKIIDENISRGCTSF